MSKKQFKAAYPEAAKFLEYLQDPTNDTKKTIETMPAWKKHFLSGYGVIVESTQRNAKIRSQLPAH